MLDQVSMSDSIRLSVGEELADDIDLVVAGEEEVFLLEGRFRVFGGEDGKVFEDIGEAGTGE